MVISYPRTRRAIILRNSSAGGQIITIVASDVQSAVSGYGIMLKPGESYTDSSVGNPDDPNEVQYTAFAGQYSAITDGAAGGLLSIFES